MKSSGRTSRYGGEAYNPAEGALPSSKFYEFLWISKEDRLRLERKKRRSEFLERMRQESLKFDEDEKNRNGELMCPFLRELQNRSIEEVRRKVIPAYTFEHFPKLPLEIQMHIWSIACRFQKARLHVVIPMSMEVGYRSIAKRSSGLENPAGDPMHGDDFEAFPLILRLCKLSRALGRRIFTRITTKTTKENAPYDKKGVYFNTACDEFYLGETRWFDFKVLVDILLLFHTIRQLSKQVTTNLNGFLCIQNLIVDLVIFGGPTKGLDTIMAIRKPHFSHSTIPYHTVEDVGPWETIEHEASFDPWLRGSQYMRPKQKYRHGKRGAWVIEHAKVQLESAYKEFAPRWKIPKIEVKFRTDGNEDEESVVEEASDDESHQRRGPGQGREGKEHDSKDDKPGAGDDDSLWYESATSKMNYEIPPEAIKCLKRQYLPCRRVTHNEHISFTEDRREDIGLIARMREEVLIFQKLSAQEQRFGNNSSGERDGLCLTLGLFSMVNRMRRQIGPIGTSDLHNTAKSYLITSEE